MTIEKPKTVARAVYERCDAKDGLISDPRQCDFDPGHDVARCPAGKDGHDGLTAARAEAARLREGKGDRTRPLCPYPQESVYSGHASSDDAANFHCAE